MNDFLNRLKQRKLVQWALAYLAAAWVLLQVLDMVGQKFGWPDVVGRILIIAACVGFFVTLLLAWYHGERGAQRITGAELLILALLLAIGGGFLWRFARIPDAVPRGPQMAGAPTPPASAIPADLDPQGSVTLARFRLQMLLRNPEAALAALAHAPKWLMARFEHSEVPQASLHAQALALMGDAAGARAQFLEAEIQLRERLQNPVTATDASRHLGIVYAGLGRKQDALAAARLAGEKMPLSHDLMVGAYTLDRLARVETQVGDVDAAIGHLGQLLDAPTGSVVAVPILKIDPAWDPLRHDPRFQALIAGGTGG